MTLREFARFCRSSMRGSPQGTQEKIKAIYADVTEALLDNDDDEDQTIQHGMERMEQLGFVEKDEE